MSSRPTCYDYAPVWRVLFDACEFDADQLGASHYDVMLLPLPLYINDLEEGVTGSILKFADDTKLFRKTKEIGDKKNLQDDIDKLVKWSEKWQMLFNFGKCKCLHTGPGNTGMNYENGRNYSN